jgi:hypothetical protein
VARGCPLPTITSVPLFSIVFAINSKTPPKNSKSCRKFQSVPAAFSSSTNYYSECSIGSDVLPSAHPPEKLFFIGAAESGIRVGQPKILKLVQKVLKDTQQNSKIYTQILKDTQQNSKICTTMF